MGINERDFAFTVEAYGSTWDVYRFEKDGKRGMMAFRGVSLPGSPVKFEIGFLKAGEFTPEQVAAELNKGPTGMDNN